VDRAGARVIELAGVTKVHRSGDLTVEALRSVDLVVCDGEFVAIMGRSGSGKTTLLGILGCLDRPSAGSYKLDGEEMANLDETRRAHVRGAKIGFVFQAYNLLPRSTAFKNVELPLVYAGVPRRERRDRALEALAEVGLASRVDHLPSQLSGGEQQRVAVARALVVQPSVVLLDEPTGNLDSASAKDLLAILDRVSESGATIVIVTHSDEVAERARRIVRLADGRVVGDERVDSPVAVGAA
jgi:putative ABC transport system ATP-binding protein